MMHTARSRRAAVTGVWLVLANVPSVTLAQDVGGELLERPARLEVQNELLGAALKALSAASGVSIAFSSDLLPQREVTCHCGSATMRQALDSLLAGLRLRYQATGSQVLIVVAHSRLLHGVVRLETDGSPVHEAAIGVLGGAGTVTSANGRFELEIPFDTVQLVVRRLGIEDRTVTVPPDREEVVVRVRPRPIDLEPLAAEGAHVIDQTRFMSTAQTSTMTFDSRVITRLPAFAEADVVRAVQAMPGTVSRSDFSTGYHVRGGESDQNLISLDGITVINPVHLGGAFSTFDVNALDRVTFITGGFPARYSGRLSSVLDLHVRGDASRFSGEGQVSLLSSKLMLTGPLGGGSYLISGRRTYADQVVRTFTRYELPYYFTDVLGKVTLPVGRGGTVAVTAYWGRDRLDDRLTEPTETDSTPVDLTFDWGNRLAGVRWSQSLGAARLETYGSVSEFSTTLGLFPDLARFDNHVRLLTAGSQLETNVGSGHRVALGASVERITATYDVHTPTFETADQDFDDFGFLPVLNRRYEPTVWSVFADYEANFAGKFLIRPGVRAEYATGAEFLGIAPRVSAKFFLTEDQAVIASAGRYYQTLHSLRDQDLPITFFEFWIGANQGVPVGQSDHLVLGYERWFGSAFQILVEGYRKIYDGLVVPNRAYSLRDEGDEFLPMTGRSWGVDLILRKHLGDLRGWVSYGFNHSEREAAGVSFPPSHDRRHTVNIVVDAPGPLGSDLGFHWMYGSPLPYSGFDGEWEHRQYSPAHHAFAYERKEPITLGINDERFPSYSRLDVSLRWTLGAPGFEWRPYLQVTNLYNRRNVFLYSFDYGSYPARRTTISQLPMFPTFGVEFKW